MRRKRRPKSQTPRPEQVALFEAFMWERFGIEPGIAEDGSHYFERWQIEDAIERELRDGKERQK